MTKEYRAKVFKSGNSLALRLPKALGLEEGTEMIVRAERGEFRFEPDTKPTAQTAVNASLGTALGLEEGTEMIVREERGEFRFEPADKPKAKIDVSGFWGKAPWLKVPSREDFEERPSTVAARKAAEEAAKKG